MNTLLAHYANYRLLFLYKTKIHLPIYEEEEEGEEKGRENEREGKNKNDE